MSTKQTSPATRDPQLNDTKHCRGCGWAGISRDYECQTCSCALATGPKPAESPGAWWSAFPSICQAATAAHAEVA